MAGNQITFGVGFNVNEAGLNKLKQSLKEIQALTARDLMGTGNFSTLTHAEQELVKIKASAVQVQDALTRAFNVRLGTTNFTQLNTELKNLKLNDIAQQWSQAGAAGRIALNNLAASTMTANVKLKQTYSIIENMKTTLSNTIKWNIASGAINSLTNSVRSAFNYVKALDSSLTDIRIVTGDSREEMAHFAVEANNAAQALGRQTKEYTNAALGFYQQGLNDEEVRVRTEATLKAQNITGAGTEITDELTAVWNGFQINIEGTESAVDKLAAVADSSASNMSELATGMSKVASVANNMGVSLDQLTAQLATIIATTRQAPETVGNALKTIYTRINDIKAGSDEAETSLGNYSSQMAKVGFNVLDVNGNLRDTGEVIEEIGSKWDTLSREQQIYLARTMAGQRQMNNLIALFDNWTKYSEMLNISLEAEGTLNEKNARYMDSLSAHINQFRTAIEGVQDSIIDEEAIKGVVDAGTSIVNFFNDLLSAIGGVKIAGVGLAGVLLNAFSGNIATGLTSFIQNLQFAKQNVEQLANEATVIRQFGEIKNSDTVAQIQQWSQQANQLQSTGVISESERNEINELERQYVEIQNQKAAWDDVKAAAAAYYKSITGQDADISKGARNNIEALEGESEELKAATKNCNEYTAAVKRARTALLNEELNTTNANRDTTTNAFRRVGAFTDRIEDTLLDVINGDTTFHLDDEVERAQAALQKYQNALATAATPHEVLNAHQAFIDDYNKIIQAAQETNREVRETFERGANGIEEDFNEASESIRTSLNNIFDTKALQQSIQGVITIIGGIGTGVAGIRSLSNAFKTLNDETKTLGERLSSAVPAIAMSVSMLSTSLGQLRRGFNMVSVGVIKFIGTAVLGKNAVAGLQVESIKAALAQKSLAESIQKVTAALFANPWTILIASLAVATVAIIGIAKHYDALANKVRKAEETTKKLNDRYLELKDTYEEVKDSLTNYQDAKAALDDMVIGTDEWREALEKVNEQIISIIDKYPELAQYVNNVNGEFVLSKEGQEAFLKTQKERVTIAQQVAQLSGNYSRILDNELTTQNLARSVRQKVWEESKYGQQGFNIADADVEKIVSAVIQDSSILLDYKKGNEAVLQEFADKIGVNIKALEAVFDKGAIQEAITAIRANTTANELVAENIAQSINEDANEVTYDQTEYKAEVNRRTAELLNNDEKIAEYVDDALERRFGGNLSEDVLKTYAAMNGWTFSPPAIQLGDKSRFFDGQEYHVIDDKDIAQAVAVRQYTLEVQGQTAEIVAAVNDLMNAATTAFTGIVEPEKLEMALSTFIGEGQGNLLNLTQDQVEKFQAWANNVGRQYLEALDIPIEEINTAVDNYTAEFDKVGDKFVGPIKALFEQITAQADSPQLKEQVGQIFTKAFAQEGREGFNVLLSLFDEINTPEKLKEVLNVLNSLTTNTSLEDLSNQLIAAGVNTEGFSESLSLLLKIFGVDVSKDIEQLTGNFNEVLDIVDGLKQGDKISKNNTELLTKFGLDMSKFFSTASDGTSILIGKAEDLKKIVNEMNINDIRDKINTINDELRSYEGQDLENISTEDKLSTLSKSGVLDNDQVANYKTKLFTGDLTLEELQQINTEYEHLSQIRLDGLIADQKALQEQLALSAQNIDQLETLFHNGEISGDQFAQSLEHAARAEADTLNLDFDSLDAYKEYLLATNDALNGNEKEAYELAIAHTRLNKGIQTLAKNWDNWQEALDSGTPEEYGKAIKELKEATADLLNVSKNALSSKFFNEDNLKDLELAADGDAEAIERLRAEASKDIFLQAFAVDNFEDLDQRWQDTLNRLINYANENNLTAYAQLDDADFVSALNEMITAANMTAEQVANALQAIGYDAEVETQVTTHPSVMQVPETTYTITPSPWGFPQSIIPSTKIINVPYEQRIETPVIRSLTYTGSAGGNITSGNVGGRSKGKGGGGGGGQKPKKPNKPFESKIDPYHDVNIKIGDVQEGIDKLQKDRDKLIGKDAVNNLAKQINLMEKEKDLLKEKAAIATEELKRQGEELANLGAIFDANNDIANYKDLLLNKQKQINEAIDISNTLQGEERDAYDDYIKDLEQEYKDLESAIKEYDETQQLLDDLGLDFQDLINQQIELAIEAFDLEINIKLDFKDAEKEFNEFRKKVINQVKDDNYAGLAASTAENYGIYYNQQGGLVQSLAQHTAQIMREAEIIGGGGFSQIYGNDLAAAAEDLKKYNDELMSALEEAQDVIDETHDHFLDAIDALNDAFDTQQENLDKIDDLLQHDMEILQLIHGEENYDEMSNLWTQQVDQDTSRLRALQEEQAYWKTQLDRYEKDTDEWKKAMENWQDAFEKTNEAMLNSVKNLQSQWENSINSIMSQLRKQTYGGNMDAALEDWDKMNWHSDRYLDSLERATGLLNLQGKYQDAINGATDIKMQEKLAQLEEKQLDALASKEHLREIDLKIAEQQLTVLQAQMALEDAQQAKTKLRLRRDSQGNYTYQYVADEENIEEKTQEYANALAEYRGMVRDSLRDDLQAISDYTQEYYDKLQEAQMKYGDDQKALMEEQTRLYKLYMGEDGYITRLALDAQSSMRDAQEATYIQALGLNNLMRKDLFEKFLGPDSDMVTAIQDLLGAGGQIPSLIDAFVNDSAFTAFDNINEATRNMLTGPEGILPEWSSTLWNIVETYETDFVPRVIEAMNQLQYANQAYVDGLAIVQTAANRTTEQIALGLAYDTAYTNALNDASQALVETQKQQVSSAEEVYNALKKTEGAFQDQAQAAIDAANANYLYWLSMYGMSASSVPYSFGGNTSVTASTPSTSSSSSSSGSYSGGGESGGGGGGSENAGSSSGKSSTDNYKMTGVAKNAAGAAAQYYQKYGGNWTATATGPKRYGSGGYTGEWNDDPRWALLDQKELVLNAADTQNILDAVDIVRAIVDKVSAFAATTSANLGQGGLLDMVAAAGQTILQDVIINADFPGVEDAAQIKQAFNELVNMASQRASGNRRAN